MHIIGSIIMLLFAGFYICVAKCEIIPIRSRQLTMLIKLQYVDKNCKQPQSCTQRKKVQSRKISGVLSVHFAVRRPSAMGPCLVRVARVCLSLSIADRYVKGSRWRVAAGHDSRLAPSLATRQVILPFRNAVTTTHPQTCRACNTPNSSTCFSAVRLVAENWWSTFLGVRLLAAALIESMECCNCSEYRCRGGMRPGRGLKLLGTTFCART